MSLEVGLRERKKIALREQLISTATRLFTENGYAETTLEHVAHENMVSIRTLLRHFESKEGLAIASLKSKATQFREEIADPARTVDSIEIWRSAVRDNALHYMDSPKMRDYHVFLTSEPQLIGVVAAIHDEYANSIAEGLASRLLLVLLSSHPALKVQNSPVSKTAQVVVVGLPAIETSADPCTRRQKRECRCGLKYCNINALPEADQQDLFARSSFFECMDQ